MKHMTLLTPSLPTSSAHEHDRSSITHAPRTFAPTTGMTGGLALLLLLAACERSPTSDAREVDPPSPAAATNHTNATPSPWFKDVAAQLNLTDAHESGVRPGRLLLPEITGGGGAMYDLDGDGWLDVLIIQGGALDEPPHDRPRDRLYRNLRGERFIDVTDASGIHGQEHGMGVAVGDIDNDGRPDLYVTNVGRNALYRNLGEMRFERITSEGGAADNGWSTGAAFADINRNGNLDL